MNVMPTCVWAVGLYLQNIIVAEQMTCDWRPLVGSCQLPLEARVAGVCICSRPADAGMPSLRFTIILIDGDSEINFEHIATLDDVIP